MLKRIWLVFAQAVAAGLGVWIAVSFMQKDDGAPRGPVQVVALKESAQAPEPGPVSTHGFRQAARKAMPSVVNIYTSKQVPVRRNPFFDDLLRRYYGEPNGAPVQRATSLGSGVIASADGHILTNNHVVEGADEIAVAFHSGETAEARVVGTDPETDLAVLKVNAKGLAPIAFGDPGGVDVGDAVLAIGNPFGVGQTVTQGIVSATGRNRLGINTFENFIQTDAAINPGNSGGALVDASGALVGINTAIYSESGGSQGIGFAIPVGIARQVMEQIIKTGRVERGWLGIEVREFAPKEGASSGQGVLIAGVLRNGPADYGGIKPGDVVVSINRRPVTDSVGLMNQIAAVAPGNTIAVTLLREERERVVDVRVGKRPPLRRAG